MAAAVAGLSAQFRLARALVGSAMTLTRGMRWEGLERLPASGPLIVAVNHVSVIDPPLIGIAVSQVRAPRFVGKEELFRFPPSGWLLRRIGVIPLDRSRGDVRAVREALEVLQGGGCMVLFPEGTRSRTGRPGKPKPGVGLMARQAGASVVPARVVNTRSWFGTGPFTVRFGEPMAPPPPAEDARSADRAYAETVMAAILAL